MKTGIIVVVSLLALSALVAFSLLTVAPKVEEDLLERSRTALKEEGLAFDSIDFDGQTAVLTGAVGSQAEKDHIEDVVSGVMGVAGVANRILVQSPVAVIICAKDEVTIINAASGKSNNAFIDTPVLNGDEISTGPTGHVALKFLDDNSLIRIRPNSRCTINAKMEENTVEKNIFVEVGSFLSRITQRETSFRVTTFTSVAAVKGTSFWTTQEFEGATSYFGEEGVIEISNEAGTVLLRAGEMCNIASKSSRLVVEKINLPSEFLKAVGDNKIIFIEGGTALNQNHYDYLSRVKEFMDKYPAAVIEIVGYTDAVGNPAANLSLSEQRARVVEEYLIGIGADPESLVSQGMGEANPIASNNTLEGRRQNRRVEFNVRESN